MNNFIYDQSESQQILNYQDFIPYDHFKYSFEPSFAQKDYQIYQISAQVKVKSSERLIEEQNPLFTPIDEYFNKEAIEYNNQDQQSGSYYQMQPNYIQDINNLPNMICQQANQYSYYNAESYQISNESQDIFVSSQISDNVCNQVSPSDFQNSLPQPKNEDEQNQYNHTDSVQNSAQQTAQIKKKQISKSKKSTKPQKQKTVPKKYVKTKKYVQDQLYKGIFQRLCVLCNSRPNNKQFKAHLTKIIVIAINNKAQAENEIVYKLAQSFHIKDNTSFVNHQLEILKNCQHSVDVTHSSVIRAVKSVNNDVKYELMKH